MADDKFKLPRSSYEEICKIIMAYGRLTQPASLNEVAKLAAMNKTVISANNAFLAKVELIEGGNSKSATQKGRDLASALEHEQPPDIQSGWMNVVKDSEFLDKMAAAVKIRGKMESTALASHIAYSAGEAKSRQVMTGARSVLDILQAAGVVLEHDGQIVSSSTGPRPPITNDVEQESSNTILTNTIDKNVRVGTTKTGAYGTTLHIELRIVANPSELDGLGEKIQGLLKELSGTDGVVDEDDTNVS